MRGENLMCVNPWRLNTLVFYASEPSNPPGPTWPTCPIHTNTLTHTLGLTDVLDRILIHLVTAVRTGPNSDACDVM